MKPGRPSSTAQVIALATVRTAATPGPGMRVLPGSAELASASLRAAGVRGRLMARAITTPPGRLLGAAWETLTVPGICHHYQRRKLLIDGWCVQALEDGFSQIVQLGAGFDALALRALGRPAPPRAIEIDHPATQRVKSEAFTLMGARELPILMPADLSTCDLSSLWTDGRLDRDRRTFVVAEGLLMYLTQARVEELLVSLSHAPFPAVRLAFTFMDAHGGAPIRFTPSRGIVDWWLKRKGEPFLSSLDGAALGPLISRLGWRLRRCVRFEHPAGESAAVADGAV